MFINLLYFHNSVSSVFKKNILIHKILQCIVYIYYLDNNKNMYKNIFPDTINLDENFWCVFKN